MGSLISDSAKSSTKDKEPEHTNQSIPSIQSLLDAAEKAAIVSRRELPKLLPIKPLEPELLLDPPRLVGGLPVKNYRILGHKYNMQAPTNETINVTTRKTIDGRFLTYKLHVIQQPERARACGAGARSSADRRPVDPPPVIELRVFESDAIDSKELNDITLKHNATFILCASLEWARPIAHGRMHTPQAVASLQGVNFAGTNYLDRPQPAGYFIFPDLSVRNEGWYRLNFSLLEGTKEAVDADPDRPFPASPIIQREGEPRKPHRYEDMAIRLDVRSTPFQVFSAKKFPGLSESTDLSRLVADQGCRVRIRRDVRMRKHADRRKDEFDPFEDGRRSGDRFATPDTNYQPRTPIDRAHSISRASMDGSQYSADHYRRASGESGYYPHVPQPALPGLAGSSAASAYTASRPMSAPSHSPYPSYHHPANPTQPAPVSNTFAVPPPRYSHDYTPLPVPQGAEPKHTYPMLLNPVSHPPTLTPDNAKADTDVTLPPVSAIYALTNPNPNVGAPAPRRGTYVLPEPTASKRSYSPQSSYTQVQPLKSGMRPDGLPSPSHVWTSGAMEADPRPYASDDDDSFGEFSLSTMKYRRANGEWSRKAIPSTHSHAP